MAKLLTKKQVSELFGISERTLDRWREEGTIGAIKVGGIVRFRKEAVMLTFLASATSLSVVLRLLWYCLPPNQKRMR
jgi:excisionase family DNA binding protein